MQEFKKTSCKDNANGCHKVLKCPQPGCSKVLTSLPGLRYHIRTHLGMEASFTCARCKKSFKSANGLKYHMEKTRCEECSTSPGVDMVLHAGSHMYSMHKECKDVKGCSADAEDEDVDILEPVVSNSLPALDVLSWENGAPADDVLSPVPYRTSLCVHKQEEIVNPLAQLAFIATGPHSPLFDGESSRGCGPGMGQGEPNGAAVSWHSQLSPTMAIHSYAKPSRAEWHPVSWKRSLSFSTPALSLDGSSGSSSGEDDIKGHLLSRSASNGHMVSSEWPVAAWQCFLPGTKVKVDSSRDWNVIRECGWKAPATFSAPHGLKLSEVVPATAASNGLSCRHLRATFDDCSDALDKTPVLFHFIPAAADDDSCLLSTSPPLAVTRQVPQPGLWAECSVDHPFFVKEKGWCSYNPSLSEERYHIPCLELDLNDVCLPASHPDAAFTVEALHSFETYDFTPEESSAVFALSNLAKLRRSDQDHDDGASSLSQSFPMTPLKKKLLLPREPDNGLLRAKRPMNAFMLFAKKFRIEYTQMFPGKDNRAISVLLGDRWKKMRNEERKAFALEAKALAEQHKRLNPDCWKRKRSASESCLP